MILILILIRDLSLLSSVTHALHIRFSPKSRSLKSDPVCVQSNASKSNPGAIQCILDSIKTNTGKSVRRRTYTNMVQSIVIPSIFTNPAYLKHSLIFQPKFANQFHRKRMVDELKMQPLATTEASTARASQHASTHTQTYTETRQQVQELMNLGLCAVRRVPLSPQWCPVGRNHRWWLLPSPRWLCH